tara:strand:- start:42 stop:338 length:297 start_codon:yes stop_codon:yes gene_type:complete
LILQFPTGSKGTDADSAPLIVGSMSLYNDSTWKVHTTKNANEDDVYILQEFVDYIAYCLQRDDVIGDFQKMVLAKAKEGMDVWRKNNFKVIDGGEKKD